MMQIIKKNYLKKFRIIWILVNIASIGCIVFTCAYQWERYAANPTVISLERDYRNWNGTLPSLTLCYSMKYDQEKADIYIRR